MWNKQWSFLFFLAGRPPTLQASWLIWFVTKFWLWNKKHQNIFKVKTKWVIWVSLLKFNYSEKTTKIWKKIFKPFLNSQIFMFFNKKHQIIFKLKMIWVIWISLLKYIYSEATKIKKKIFQLFLNLKLTHLGEFQIIWKILSTFWGRLRIYKLSFLFMKNRIFQHYFSFS